MTVTISRVDEVRRVAEGLKDERGPLLEILLAVQRELGYVDEADLPVIAGVLNISLAEVHGVVGFYHDLRTTPPAAHTLRLCRAEACQSVGAQQLFEHATQQYGARDDLELREVFCFGNCALGPTGEIDGRLFGRLDPDRLQRLIEEATS